MDVLPDYPILTPVAGFGEAWMEAVHKALTDWLHRILEPVQAALGIRPEEPRAQMAATSLDTGLTTTWDVFEGPTEIVAVGADAELVRDQLSGEQQPLVLVLAPLAGLVGDFPDRPLHWVKLFLARKLDGNHVVECQLDNVDWPFDLDKLHAFKWLDQPGYMAVKYFAVLVRTDYTPKHRSHGRSAP